MGEPKERDAATQERYVRLVEASGVRPEVDLSPAGQLVLSQIASLDDDVCSGVTEVLRVARARAVEPLAHAGQRLVKAIDVFRANNGTWHVSVHSSAVAIEAREAMREAIAAAGGRG